LRKALAPVKTTYKKLISIARADLIKIHCMKWNWLIIALLISVVLLLAAWIAKQNQKDKKSLVQELDNDYQVPKENEPQI
jgi:hypothetical protein